MKQYLDKLKATVNSNKKMITFLVGLMLVGIIAGSIFVAFLNKADQSLLKEYLNNFLTNIDQNQLNYHLAFLNTIIGNLFFVLTIWLLGISVIGIPIMLFMFFTKAFVLGFSVTSIVLNYQLKGAIFAFLYMFPHHLINMGIYIMLLLYSLTVSFKILKAMIKKEAFDFKQIIKKYSMILLYSFIGILFTTVLEIYVVPNVLKTVIPFLK